MQVALLCSAAQKDELGDVSGRVTMVQDIHELAAQEQADVLVDLLYEEYAAEHRPVLQHLNNKVIVVALLAGTCAQLPSRFIRINGWPTFLQGKLVEACGGSDHLAKQQVEAFFASLNKQLEWVPDVPGMISARVITAVINEAYFALQEGVATREDMDTAMKLGTAYPYGPFEWAEKIGAQRIASLLRLLALEEGRYTPCLLLEQQAWKGAVPK